MQVAGTEFTGVKAPELRNGDVLFEPHIRMPTLK
jgi:hypothetical protein